MKTVYSFVVLRYVHDIASGEFVNVGVALYSPDTKYIGALCSTRYGRLSKMFLDVDGDYFRGLMRHIETRFDEIGGKLREELPFDGTPAGIIEIARTVLPPDDSSLQWSEAGGGWTENPARTLEELFTRLVARYEDGQKRLNRDDSEVWKVFKKELETRQVLARLQPKRIITGNYDYEFEHAWKNQKWHLYEPVSFDLQEADSILDKANRWVGRAVSLQDSPDKFKLHLLLGEPSIEKLRPAFIKAENILNKIPGDKEFVREHEAEKFSATLANT